MENLNFINPLLHGIIPEELEQKASNISTKQLVCAGVGTLIAGIVLKKAGHNKAGALIGGLALPILASALYKKFGSSTESDIEDFNSQIESQAEHA
ncbi:PrgI family protein [Flavobacterium piscis]|uniref:PrgI family protein n=1 Tax=Flavobacterium piscis TaxID=1114874 RepID=A0ABU1YDH5_9FLAO|nr:PrgI family protein [Flavobacterium piscis]MDR7211571.1 hypothetical protein [Flavobacterium piscis]